MPLYKTEKRFFKTAPHLEAYIKRQADWQDQVRNLTNPHSIIYPRAWKVIEFDQDKLNAVVAARGVYKKPERAFRINSDGSPEPGCWEAHEFLALLASDNKLMTNCSIASWLVWFDTTIYQVRWAQILLKENNNLYDHYR